MDANVDEEFDVVVVGAGFGGPVAAKKCAEAGLRTLMLERAAAPGEKVVSGLVIPVYGFLFGPAFIRKGNPPIERPICSVVNRLVRDGEIFCTDRSLRVPKPVALGYAAYCKPFCTWLADRAVEAGAELRTSTAAMDVLREGAAVTGVVTDAGRRIGARLVIDAGGTQNGLSIKAGIREKYTAESIELYMLWDLEMAKEEVDRVFGHSMEFFHAFPEEGIGAPLGYGSTFYIFTYRDSIHPGLGQFLVTEGKTPDVAESLPRYIDTFTRKVTRWKEDIAPLTRLRAVMWDVCPIYAGLLPRTRQMAYHGAGMLIVGDAAGFEASAFGDGVPNAWFSADIAADVAIEALTAGDVSASFLHRYEERVQAHPFIIHTISDPRRWNMRLLLKDRSEEEFKAKVKDHGGIGAFRWHNMGGPVVSASLSALRKDPAIAMQWAGMFSRYFDNWEHNRFDPLSTQT